MQKEFYLVKAYSTKIGNTEIQIRFASVRSKTSVTRFTAKVVPKWVGRHITSKVVIIWPFVSF